MRGQHRAQGETNEPRLVAVGENLHAMRVAIREAIRDAIREAIREAICEASREAIREAIRKAIKAPWLTLAASARRLSACN